MLVLPDRCDQWRLRPVIGQPGKKTWQVTRSRVPCMVLPITQIDTVAAYYRDSTHRIFLPRWLSDVQPEDELRVGRVTDAFNVSQASRYTVVGLRRFRTFGLRHTETFVRLAT